MNYIFLLLVRIADNLLEMNNMNACLEKYFLYVY